MTADGEESSAAVKPAKRVGLAEYAVIQSPGVLKTHGLGSCIAIGLYDPVAEVGGLAHAMLPECEDCDIPGKYVTTAIETLIDELVAAGASQSRLEAHLAGGSSLFEFDGIGDSIGSRNVAMAEARLDELNIPIIAAEVGGHNGRTVELDTETGTLRITTTGGDSHDR